MTTVKVLDVISRLLDCACAASGAASAYAQVKKRDAPDCPNQNVQRVGYVYHFLDVQHHGTKHKTRWDHLKDIDTDINWQVFCPSVNSTNSYSLKFGRKFLDGNANFFTAKKGSGQSVNVDDTNLAIQQLSTQVLNPTTESKRAVKQLIQYLKGTQHTCLRLEPREMVQTGLLELVGRSDSDWAGDSATRQSVTGYHCDVQNVTMCNRSLKQRLRRRIVGTRRTLQGTSPQSFSSSRNRLRLGKTHSAAQGTRWTQTHRDTMLVNTAVDTRETSFREPSGHEEQNCRSFTKHRDGLRRRAFAKKLGLRFLDMDGGTNEEDR